MTHVLISGGLHQRKMAFKALKFAEHIQDIVSAAIGTKGCRYSLQLTGQSSTKLVLVKNPTPEEVAKVQQTLQLKI